MGSLEGQAQPASVPDETSGDPQRIWYANSSFQALRISTETYPRMPLRAWPGVWGSLCEQSEYLAPPAKRPRQDSNLRHRLRRPVLYPLSYGGGSCKSR